METEFTFQNYVATCTNKNCENVDINIEVTATLSDPNVICGPCSVKITKLETI
jgi:hypothetical protein